MPAISVLLGDEISLGDCNQCGVSTTQVTVNSRTLQRITMCLERGNKNDRSAAMSRIDEASAPGH
jgi:hypothetical protein